VGCSSWAYLKHDLEIPTANTGTINIHIFKGRCWRRTFRQVAATPILKNNTSIKHHDSTRMGQWRTGPTHSQLRYYIEMMIFTTRPLRSPVNQRTSDWTEWTGHKFGVKDVKKIRKKSLARLWNRSPFSQQLVSYTAAIHDLAITKVIWTFTCDRYFLLLGHHPATVVAQKRRCSRKVEDHVLASV